MGKKTHKILNADAIKAMRTSLLAGRYNLLVGAGINHGAKNRYGESIPTGEELRKLLNSKKNLRASSSLQRVYSQLTPEEVGEYLTKPFSGCVASEVQKQLPTFAWNRIYSLNIDDCLEDAYASPNKKQTSQSLTHKSGFRNVDFRQNLHIVHIHGFAQVPQDGYVFSFAEYAANMAAGSMHFA